MNFARRRIRNSAVLVIAIVLTFIAFEVIALSLQTQQYLSGWLLAGLLAGLLAFYVKKKLSVLPLGSNAGWAQWHYYGGFFAVAVFLIHTEFAIPNGQMERILAGLLGLVVIAGIAGLLIDRAFARRLAFLGEEVLFERIDGLRAELKERIENELLESVEASKSSTLSDYYLTHLADYFSARRDTLAHLLGRRQPHQRRLHDLELQMRYLNQTEAAFSLRLAGYLEQKYTLDAHYALQGAMKYWGLAHAPVGLLLLVAVLAHIVLVYAFRGAA